jgi:Ca2+-transporting ATPase
MTTEKSDYGVEIMNGMSVAGTAVKEGIVGSLRGINEIEAEIVSLVRDGMPKEVRAEEVIPGDILVLKPGSYIAADSRIIEAQRLSVDESALTGESVPVNKLAATLTNPDLPLADRLNMLYMGTLVTGGQGLAVVVGTGRSTEIGHIQLLLMRPRLHKLRWDASSTRWVHSLC